MMKTRGFIFAAGRPVPRRGAISRRIGLAHQAQIGFDELDPGHVRIAERLTDDEDARAMRCDEPSERASEAAGSAYLRDEKPRAMSTMASTSSAAAGGTSTIP